MSAVESGISEDGALAQLGRHWGVVFFMGLVSLVLGIVLMAWPGKSTTVIAVIFAIWLVATGVIEIVRGFGHGLSAGGRTLFFITGLLSVILGALMLRGGAWAADDILAIFVGISFLFRGVALFFIADEDRAGRGWNIFGGILAILGGLILLAWPAALDIVVWVVGIWMVFGGIFWIITSFRLKKVASA